MINVTKTFLPPFDEYTAILKRAWDKAWITNNGELVLELEDKIRQYLGVPNFLYCNNGTITLQIALKALGITKEVITTPFSYVATTNAIIWEGGTPVFVDIEPASFCIDPNKIEEAITENTQAILATHVYGMPCDTGKIEEIANRYKLKIIYDAAHAFGCIYKNRSLLAYGDIATCSFHATKIFHTVEGGCIITPDNTLAERIRHYRSFGHLGDEYFSIGINGKNSEFHAAMGLCNLNHLSDIIAARKKVTGWYNENLKGMDIQYPIAPQDFTYNYAYYPAIFASEIILKKVIEALNQYQITPRRYFYPSLNKLPFIKSASSCPVSESISARVLCLPLFYDLAEADVKLICSIIKNQLG